MRLGAWVMISPKWGFPPRRRQRWGESRLFSDHPEHPLAGNTDATTDPKPSPDLAVSLALPGGCLQVGLDGHPSLVRDRGLRSPALCWSLSGGLLPGFHGVERGTGKTPGRQTRWRPRQTRAGRGGGTHRRDLRRPKGPGSAWPPFHLHDQLPGFMAMSSSAFTGGLRSLSEARIPAIAFSRLLEPSTPNCRDKSHRLATAAGQPRTLASDPPLAKSQRACRRNLARGKRGRAKLALVYHRPINSNFVLKIVGHVPVLTWTLRLSQFCVQGNRVRLTNRRHGGGSPKLEIPASFAVASRSGPST